jgi:hypothetical protein
MKTSILAALAATIIGLVSGQARATTITLSNLGEVSSDTGGALISGPNVTLFSSFGAPQSIGANPSDPSGWDPWGASDSNSNWLSVGGCCGYSGSGTHPFATFTFSVPETTFTLLWGSPNSNNTVTLYSGADGTGSVIGTVSFEDGQGYFVNGVQNGVSYGANTTGPGDIISISSSVAFQSAILTNDIGGFEVADISTTPLLREVSATPLPGSWSMMLIGLAGLGLAVRFRPRRSSRAVA